MIDVSDRFHNLANAGVRPINWKTEISFTKQGSTTIEGKNKFNLGSEDYSEEDFTLTYEGSQININGSNPFGSAVQTGVKNLDIAISEDSVLSFTELDGQMMDLTINVKWVDDEMNEYFVDWEPGIDPVIIFAGSTITEVAINLTTPYSGGDSYSVGVQLETGTTATEYEPYTEPHTDFDYVDLSERAIGLSVSRSFEFPYNVQSAIADISLDNHDGYLSFAGATVSPIASYILPKRLLRIGFGFKTAGVATVFNGFTQNMPTYEGSHDSTMKWTAMDKLSELGAKHLPNMVMMRNARTDQVIRAIFTQLGLSSDEYHLEEGRNIIPFVYFDADKSVANALRELVQAENGRMWQDEYGIIQFTARRLNRFANYTTMVFNGDNILSLTPSRSDAIVNTVNISAEIRQIEATQQVFLTTNDNGYQSAAKDDQYRVPANGQATVWLAFDDPVWSAIPLQLNASNTSSFTAVNLSGTKVNSRITAVGTLFATTYKVVFTNTNAFPVSISSIQLFGEPAKLVGGQNVEYQAYDEASVEKFGNMTMEITENKCFGSAENLRNYGQSIIQSRSDYNRQIKVVVKGEPSLQLGDGVQVDYEDFQGIYEVVAIENRIDNVSESKLETEMTLDFISSGKPFILDQSILNGTDVLG